MPKTNDLLYRLLLEAVECGPTLHWLSDEAQRCPLDGELQTIEHIWVDCGAADEIWGAFERIYFKASKGRASAQRPENGAQIIGMLALGPRRDYLSPHRQRYPILRGGMANMEALSGGSV